MPCKPPCFIRLTWQNEVFGLPDEEDYAVEPSAYWNQGRRKIAISRRQPAVSDQWIYDLFLSDFTDQQIAQRCGISQKYVGKRLKDLLDAGIITEDQLHRRRSAIQRQHNRGKGQLVGHPWATDDTIRKIVRHYRKTSSTRETARVMGVAPSTVSRYVYWVDYTRKEVV